MYLIDEVLNNSENYMHNLLNFKQNCVYFDIETTGFAPATTQLYLIGAVYQDNSSFHFRQWFAESPADEAELLKSFVNFLSDKEAIVHYNGTGFDIPYIIKKCQIHHIECDFSHLLSLDIYKIALPVKAILKLENFKQKSVEDFLGIEREDLYNGGQLIEVYHRYLATKDDDTRALLLLHNHDDVIGMLQILPIINYSCFADGEYQLISMELRDGRSSIGLPIKELYIELALERFLPKRISFGNNSYYCTASGSTAKICIQVYTDELKFFYPNYKDYYYLPAEDRSIHKSVAFYVDKEFRTKAKAANCYSKRTGTFLPQYEEIISPYFKIDYYDKISYFEYTEEFRNNEGQILDYLKHIFRVLIRN